MGDAVQTLSGPDITEGCPCGAAGHHDTNECDRALLRRLRLVVSELAEYWGPPGSRMHSHHFIDKGLATRCHQCEIQEVLEALRVR